MLKILPMRYESFVKPRLAEKAVALAGIAAMAGVLAVAAVKNNHISSALLCAEETPESWQPSPIDLRADVVAKLLKVTARQVAEGAAINVICDSTFNSARGQDDPIIQIEGVGNLCLGIQQLPAVGKVENPAENTNHLVAFCPGPIEQLSSSTPQLV